METNSTQSKPQSELPHEGDVMVAGTYVAPERNLLHPAYKGVDRAGDVTAARDEALTQIETPAENWAKLNDEKLSLYDRLSVAHAQGDQESISKLENDLDIIQGKLDAANKNADGVARDKSGNVVRTSALTAETDTDDSQATTPKQAKGGAHRRPKPGAVKTTQEAFKKGYEKGEKARKRAVRLGSSAVKPVVQKAKGLKRTPEITESDEGQWAAEISRLDRISQEHNIPFEKLLAANVDMRRDQYAEVLAKHAGSAVVKSRELTRARVAYETAVNAAGAATAGFLIEGGHSLYEVAEISIMGNLGWDKVEADGSTTTVPGEEEKLVDQIRKFKQLRAGGRANESSMRTRYGAEMTADRKTSDDAEYLELANHRYLDKVEDPRGFNKLKQRVYETWHRWGETKKGKVARAAVMMGFGAGLGVMSALTGGATAAVATAFFTNRAAKLVAGTKLHHGSHLTMAEAEANVAKEDIKARREAGTPNLSAADMVDKYNQEAIAKRKSNQKRLGAAVLLSAFGSVTGAAAHAGFEHMFGHHGGATGGNGHETTSHQTGSDRDQIQQLKQEQAAHNLDQLRHTHEIDLSHNSTIYEAFGKQGIHFNKVVEMAGHARHAGELREVHMGNGNFFYEVKAPNGGWTDNTHEVAKVLLKHAGQSGVKGRYDLAA